MIHHASSAVKGSRASLPSVEYNPLSGASAIERFRYFDKIAKQWRTRCFGYDNGIACSDRTRAGKLHESPGFNIDEGLLGQLTQRGYELFLIRIHWKNSGILVHYETELDAFYQFGEIQDRYDGPQVHLPLHYWSINGQPPAGPQPEPEPCYTQPLLIDHSEPQRAGGALLI